MCIYTDMGRGSEKTSAGDSGSGKSGGKDSGCACFNIRRAARAITRLYDDTIRSTGLKSSQVMLLMGVREMGPVSVGILAEEAVLDRTTLTRNLRPLEREGLVRIEQGMDRRERMISLTVKGDSRLKDALPALGKAQKKVEELVGGDCVTRVIADLGRLVGVTTKASR